MIRKILNSFRAFLIIVVSTLKWKKFIPIVTTTDKDKLLDGRVALITGGSGGIGLTIAKTFLASGCKVILAGTNELKLRQKADEIGADEFLVINMEDVSSFDFKIKEAASVYGGRIDIFVNSHGIHTKRGDFDFLNVKEEEYRSVMDINLKGTYFICQAVARYMISNQIRGKILIISSQSALEPSWSPYRLSKLGISGITEGMAQKLLPYGIVVNAIAPGPTATTMQEDLVRGSIYTRDNPIERYTMPEEVAEFARMLVSSLGDTIVGDTLYMSGGRGIIDKR